MHLPAGQEIVGRRCRSRRPFRQPEESGSGPLGAGYVARDLGQRTVGLALELEAVGDKADRVGSPMPFANETRAGFILGPGGGAIVPPVSNSAVKVMNRRCVALDAPPWSISCSRHAMARIIISRLVSRTKSATRRLVLKEWQAAMAISSIPASPTSQFVKYTEFPVHRMSS
jgi:hypothetical protein